MKQTKLGILLLSLFLALVIGGAYARYNHSRDIDNSFFNGISYTLWARAIAQPTPTPPPPPPAQNLNEREEMELFGAFLFGKDWPLFREIIACESGWDKEVVSKTDDTGLAQISAIHQVPQRWLKKWRVNLVIAYELFKSQGTNPWRYSEECWRR